MRNPLATSLAARLSLAFIMVVLLGVASVSVLVRVETTRGFETYLDAQGRNYLARVAGSLADLYEQSGGWSDSGPLLSSLLRGPSDRLMLADTAGRVVADTSGELLGRGTDDLVPLNQIQVTVGQDRVGTLYLLAFTPGPGSPQGRGQGAAIGRGQGPMAGTDRAKGAGAGAQQTPASLESSYLASVDHAILTAALLSALVAIVVGLVVSRRITKPLTELAEASRKLASGRLDHRLKVTTGDELGRVASTFNSMAEKLQSNEDARRHMVADIAHDLRTPLTVIQGMVDGMLDGVIDLDRTSLESIKEEAGILTKLVADLRTLSLAEAGQLKLEKVEIDLLEFARRSLEKVDPIARARGIACQVEGRPPGPLVEIDQDRMGQVMGNLLGNALRYTPEGGAITVFAGPGEGRNAILSVTDTGIGIGPEDLSHIFDRFYRADSSRARKSGGSGLGLAIVKQLVEAHGGTVIAESRPGSGTRFTIRLPLANNP